MRVLKEILSNLGPEGWTFSIISLGSVIFGVLGFFGVLPFNQEQTISILIGAIGILMGASITQNARRHADLLELKNLLGVADAQLLDKKEAAQHSLSSVLKTRHFILDTFMNWTISAAGSNSYLSRIHTSYNRLLIERLVKGEIEYREVQVIYHHQGLEYAIQKMLLNRRYLLRHYDPPDVAIPILQLQSFDNEWFYLLVGKPKGASVDYQMLYIREPHVNQLLKDYYQTLWDEATPLNPGGVINWEELKRISSRVGMTEKEYEAMVSKAKDEVQREKRKLFKQ